MILVIVALVIRDGLSWSLRLEGSSSNCNNLQLLGISILSLSPTLVTSSQRLEATLVGRFLNMSLGGQEAAVQKAVDEAIPLAQFDMGMSTYKVGKTIIGIPYKWIYGLTMGESIAHSWFCDEPSPSHQHFFYRSIKLTIPIHGCVITS
jgi:hypothetical protein